MFFFTAAVFKKRSVWGSLQWSENSWKVMLAFFLNHIIILTRSVETSRSMMAGRTLAVVTAMRARKKSTAERIVKEVESERL